MHNLEIYQRAGQRAGLISAALGLGVAAILTLMFGLGEALKSGSGWLLLSGVLASVLGFASVGGGWVSLRIRKGGRPWLLGIALAFATVILPTVLMSLLVWIYSVPTLRWGVVALVRDLGDYVLRPLYGIGITGALPACALGLLYGELVQRAHRRLDRTDAASG